MQVCTSLQTDIHANTPPLSFFSPDALPASQPTALKHGRNEEGIAEETEGDRYPPHLKSPKTSAVVAPVTAQLNKSSSPQFMLQHRLCNYSMLPKQKW